MTFLLNHLKKKRDSNRAGRRKRPFLLKAQERYRLLYGPYEPPLVKKGLLVDAVRGKVPFGTFSNALIPWPKFKRRGRGGSGGFVLCGDLIRALEKESAPAISYHWGVSRGTIGNWRRALEMKGWTAGAQRLVKLGVELARLPESREKIAVAARGRRLSARHRSRFLGAMHQGWKKRFGARRAAYRKTGRFPRATKSDPWIPEEQKLLPKFRTAELVRILGRTYKSIQARRLFLDIRARPRIIQQPWKEWETRLLGTASDRAIAKQLKRSLSSVTHRRRRVGIKSPSGHFWTAEEEAIIGKVSDTEAARRLGRTRKAIAHRRRALGMVLYHVDNARKWTVREEALLGTDVDSVVAKRLGRTTLSVATKRREKGIRPKTKVQAWTSQEIGMLGKMSDKEVGQKLGRTELAVACKRSELKIAAGKNRRWTRAEDGLLGKMSDEEAARRLRRAMGAVKMRRWVLQIPIFRF